MEQRYGLAEWLEILKKKKGMIIGGMLIGLALSYFMTAFVLTAKYETTTQLLVSRPVESGQILNIGEIETNIQLINTYKDIIEDPVILNDVMAKTGYDQGIDSLRQQIDIVVQEESQIFGIKVIDTDPIAAAEIANTVAETFQDTVGLILSVENVAILSPAEIRPVPVSPNMSLNLVVGGITGLLFGLVAGLMHFLLDRKIHDEETALDILGWRHLGSLSVMTPEDRTLPANIINQAEDGNLTTPAYVNKEAKHVS